jgi:hypothetical protein
LINPLMMIIAVIRLKVNLWMKRTAKLKMKLMVRFIPLLSMIVYGNATLLFCCTCRILKRAVVEIGYMFRAPWMFCIRFSLWKLATSDVLNCIPGAELEGEDDEPAEGIELGPSYPWEGTDRDYKYDEVRLRNCLLVVFCL